MSALHKKNMKRLNAKGESRMVSADFGLSVDDHNRTIYNPATSGAICTISPKLPEDTVFTLVNGAGVETIVRPPSGEALSLGGGELHTAGSGVVLGDSCAQTWQKIGSWWVGVAASLPAGASGVGLVAE